jgi:predicted nucleotidyltransferase
MVGFMATDERRKRIREALIQKAESDHRVTGAAITGSAARETVDRWSDVDLFFGVASGHQTTEIIAEWTEFVYREFAAIHHFDGYSGIAVYRSFLLADLLEVDLGFAPASAFGPLGAGGFRVVFGTPAPRRRGTTDVDQLAGHAWHHVLHARIGIERGLGWQAEYWISRLRDNTLALACDRLGLPGDYNKHADELPPQITAAARDALVRDLETGELLRALTAATHGVIRELHESHPTAAQALEEPLLALATTDFA